MFSEVKNDNVIFLNRITKYPQLFSCVESILDIIENSDSKLTTADNAEAKTIDETRKLGNVIMQSWGSESLESSTNQLKSENNSLRNKGKITINWHTTFGDISIEEPIFSKDGKTYRPFSDSAEIKGRQCSKALQRAIVDFGADHPFAKASGKLKEHYGIDLSPSTISAITKKHAEDMLKITDEKREIPATNGSKVQIGGIDGCMIPTVSTDKNSKDKRKNKILSWKEVKLSIVHNQGSVTPKFGAVLSGSVDDAGQALLNAAIMCGFGQNTYLHSVGDGAKWIANQIENKFGDQGNYLIDMYHAADYLYAASKTCAISDKQGWVDEQKSLLKSNQYQTVLDNLSPHIENEDLPDTKSPVRKCFRYLNNRQSQLNYKYAIDNDLPIGSGEVESAHRYVIQDRLKLAGAWWKEENANSMIALRIIRANDMWNDYWDNIGMAA